MAIILDIFDQFGHQSGVIQGVRVSGPLKGYRGLRYTPRGSCIGKAGTATVSLPLGLKNNKPLAVGSMIGISDTRYGKSRYDQGMFFVTDKAPTISADGYWATFNLAGRVEELRWPDVPGFTSLNGEWLSSVYNRLLLIQEETPWTVKMAPGSDFQLFDNTFQTDGSTVQQAVDALTKAWFFNWKEGDGRVIEVGTFRQDSGIRLMQPSGRPAAMNRDHIRPINPGGLSPVEDAAGIINCVIGLGTGEGWAQVSLRDLYNPVGETQVPGFQWFKSGPPVTPAGMSIPWTGWDPAFPIFRRRRLDGALDGFQYFMCDMTSIGNYRRRFYRLNTNIGIVSSEPTDLQAAAGQVYSLCLNSLKSRSVQHDSFTVNCVGRGSNVGIGGNTVWVEYPRLNVKGNYVVTDCERSVSDEDGSYADVFTVSNIGRGVLNDEGIQLGMIQDIQAMRTAATVFPSRDRYFIDEPITTQSPIVLPWDTDDAILSVVQALFTVSCLPVYSTVTGGAVGAHHHSTKIPGRTQDATVPYTSETGYNPGSQFSHGHTSNTFGVQGSGYSAAIPSGQLGHGHGDSITAGRTGSGGVTAHTADDVTNSIRTHNHTFLVQGGGTPDIGDGVVYIRPGGNPYGSIHLQTSKNGTYQGQIGTDYPGTWSPSAAGHGHGDSITAGRTGGSVNGINSGGNMGSYGLDDPNSDGGLRPFVDNSGTGWQPSTNFPGYPNNLSYDQVLQTSDDIAPGFTPVYGKFEDPNGKATGVKIYVGSTLVTTPANPTGVWNGEFVVDLSPFLTATATTITFTSLTLGRLLIRGKVRYRETIYKIG